MVFTKELIDLLQLLRKRFKEENLGLLQLSSPVVLEDMVSMATYSTCNITKDLTYAAIQLADLPLSREDLEPLKQKDIQADGDTKNSQYRMYRGQRVLIEPKPSRTTSGDDSTRTRVYRGQVVA